MNLPLVEIFLSLQGEGIMNGEPSIFIRLGGCNMTCPKLGCDTVRAVDTKAYKHTWQNVNAKELIALFINTLPLNYKSHVVITGGEPLIHCNNPEFLTFCQYLASENYHVTIETNATKSPDFSRYPFFSKFFYALSVKLSSSGEAKEKRLNHYAIQELTRNSNCFYKFVVIGENEEYEEICDVLTIANAPVVCMPIGGNRNELEKNALPVWNFCLIHGFRYTDRLHIRLFDTKEGV